MQPDGIAQGSGRNVQLADLLALSNISQKKPNLIQGLPTKTELKETCNTVYDKIYFRLLELGIIDQNGLLTEGYQDLKLPELTYEINRIKDFIVKTEIIIKYNPTAYGREYIAKVSLANFFTHFLQLCSQSEFTQIKKIEFVGGKVASFLDWRYFKNSIQCLLNRYEEINHKRVDIATVFTHEIEKAIAEELSSPCGDIDLRIFMPKLTSHARDWLRSQIIQFIAFKTIHLPDPTVTENYAFDNLGRKGSKENPSLIVSVSDRNREFQTQFDFCFHSGIPRKYFAGRDALKAVVYDDGWLQEPRLESDFQNGWNFILSRCTRRLYIPEIEEVNEKGWGIYKSLELRNYQLVQDQAESKLLITALRGVPEFSDKGVYFCSQIWMELIKHHHDSNPYDAILLLISFYNSLKNYLTEDEQKYFIQYAWKSLKELHLWLISSDDQKPIVKSPILVLDQLFRMVTMETFTFDLMINQLKQFLFLDLTRPSMLKDQIKFRFIQSKNCLEIIFYSNSPSKARKIDLFFEPMKELKEPFLLEDTLRKQCNWFPTDPKHKLENRKGWEHLQSVSEDLFKKVEGLINEGKNVSLALYLSSSLDVIGAPPKLYPLLIRKYPDLILNAKSIEERLEIHQQAERILSESAFKQICPLLQGFKTVISDPTLSKDDLYNRWILGLGACSCRCIDNIFLEQLPEMQCSGQNFEYFSKLLLDLRLLERFPRNPKVSRCFLSFSNFIHNNPQLVKRLPKTIHSRLVSTFHHTLNYATEFPAINPTLYFVAVVQANIGANCDMKLILNNPDLSQFEPFFYKHKKYLLSHHEEAIEIITSILIAGDTGHDQEWLTVLAEVEEKLNPSLRAKFHKSLYSIFFYADLSNRKQFKRELISLLQVTYYPYQNYLHHQIVKLIEDALKGNKLEEAFALIHIFYESFQALSNRVELADLISRLTKCCKTSPENLDKLLSIIDIFTITDKRCWDEILEILKLQTPEQLDKTCTTLLKIEAKLTDSNLKKLILEQLLSVLISSKSSLLLDFLGKFTMLKTVFKDEAQNFKKLGLEILDVCIIHLNKKQHCIQTHGIQLYNFFMNLAPIIDYSENKNLFLQRILSLISILNLSNDIEAPVSALQLIIEIVNTFDFQLLDENALRTVKTGFKRVGTKSSSDYSLVYSFLKSLINSKISTDYQLLVLQGFQHIEEKNIRRLLLDLVKKIIDESERANFVIKKETVISFFDRELDVSSRELPVLRDLFLVIHAKNFLSVKEFKKFYERFLSIYKTQKEAENTLATCENYIAFICKTLPLYSVKAEDLLNLSIPLFVDLITKENFNKFVEHLTNFHFAYVSTLESPKISPPQLAQESLPEYILAKDQAYGVDPKTVLVVTEKCKEDSYYPKIKDFYKSLFVAILTHDKFWESDFTKTLNFLYANISQLIRNHPGGFDQTLLNLFQTFIFSIFLDFQMKEFDTHKRNIVALMKEAIEKGIFKGQEEKIIKYSCWIETSEFDHFSVSRTDCSDIVKTLLLYIYNVIRKQSLTHEFRSHLIRKCYNIFRNAKEKWLDYCPQQKYICLDIFSSITELYPFVKLENKYLYDLIAGFLLKGEYFVESKTQNTEVAKNSNLNCCLNFINILCNSLTSKELNPVSKHQLCMTAISFNSVLVTRFGFTSNPNYYCEIIKTLLPHVLDLMYKLKDKSSGLLINYSGLFHPNFSNPLLNGLKVMLANTLLIEVKKMKMTQTASYIFQSFVENNMYEGFPKEFKNMLSIIPARNLN